MKGVQEMSIRFEQKKNTWQVLLGKAPVIAIETPDGCRDSFEAINDKAFRWTRVCGSPADHMKMRLKMNYKPRYWQVPAVNYNGNGWGSGAQYFGYGDGGEPWSYAWHRVAIPACTYTESDQYAVALFGDEAGGMSCSVYEQDGMIVQELIWPEIEAPKVLCKRYWGEPYYGTMAPQDTFSGIVMLMPAGKPRERVKDLLDFAWKFFYRELKMPHTPERVKQLDILAFRSLYVKNYEGITGFANGKNWNDEAGVFALHQNIFEIGWVGQNGAQACALLDEYIATGEVDLRDKALNVLDSWDQYAFRDNGLMLVRLNCDPKYLDNRVNGDIPLSLDACNLGTAATYFFRAAMLCEKAGIDRPAYRKRALGLCDFFVCAQRESGEFAKSYFIDGAIESAHGSVGAFIILPLMDAYELTGEEKYRAAALRGIDFYLDEFSTYGYTTAGALDSNCIDKESAAPVLRAALRAYGMTGDIKYRDAAVEVGYYLATWQWHYSTTFPEGTLGDELGFDTYGSTSVSAAHNALDHYGLYWVPEYVQLAEITGDEMWAQRARALWYNGTQLLSDGTLVIKGRVRPAGTQDESFRHTRWYRTDNRSFIPSEWCTVWQGTFRHLAQEVMEDQSILR
jgi:hypothetical protein